MAEAAREGHASGESSGESASTQGKRHLRKPNVFMAVPTIYSKMIEAAEHNVLGPGIVSDATKTLSEMRLMISGSAALPVSLNEKWKKLTGHILLEVRPVTPCKHKVLIVLGLLLTRIFLSSTLLSEIWHDRVRYGIIQSL